MPESRPVNRSAHVVRKKKKRNPSINLKNPFHLLSNPKIKNPFNPNPNQNQLHTHSHNNQNNPFNKNYYNNNNNINNNIKHNININRSYSKPKSKSKSIYCCHKHKP